MTDNAQTGKTGLTLREIAAWQLGKKVCDKPEAIAVLPALQRGAVWRPDQIELLWDSLFRGFPCGAIVLSDYIEAQKYKKTQFGNQENGQKATHHILDGQQRANAIALGFYCPKTPCEVQSKPVNSLLWIDLAPKTTKGSRQYVFSATTKAHPWGFTLDDGRKTISNEQIQEFLKIYQKKNGEITCKTNIILQKSVPQMANLPIPLGLLLSHFDGEKVNWKVIKDSDWGKHIDCWLKKKLEVSSSKESPSLDSFCLSQDFEQQRENITNALQEVMQLTIPIIYIEGEKKIEDIELIFSRLNNKGTPISQEELRYSLIKAYCPEVEETISEIDNLPLGEARLVNLALRAAKMIKEEKFQDNFTTQQIRDIFKTKNETREEYLRYIKEKMPEAMEWIKENLVYSPNNKFGIPPYLRSSIGWESEELFLWWFLLAHKDKEITPEQHKRIIGLSLSIHWFSFDSNYKKKVMKKLWELWFLPEENWENWKISDLDPKQEHNIAIPEKPDKLQKNLSAIIDCAFNLKDKLSTLQNLRDLMEATNRSTTDNFYYFLDQLCKKQEFLVYIQREQLASLNYDPSNQNLWKSHNRPWDYDHMLATNNLNAKGSRLKKYTRICKLFQKGIGNQMALEFSVNRSKRDREFSTSYNDSGEIKEAFYLNLSDNKVKVKDFDLTLDRTDDPEHSKKYVNAVMKRLCVMYEKWFDDLELDKLIHEPPLLDKNKTNS